MKRVNLQLAYVLHRRAYRETSFLVEIFTPEHGRLTVIAKGIKKRRNAAQGLLQPFVPLLVSWAGRQELVSLVDVEQNGAIKHLQGNCLFAGLYLNELLMYLLQKWDAHPNLYQQYEKTLDDLSVGTSSAENYLEEKHLRIFEKHLLEEIGYGFLPKTEKAIANAFVADCYYRFVPEHGFMQSEQNESAILTPLFSGKNLIAIAKGDWQNTEVLKDAKRLVRYILAPLLGKRAIYSRQLFSHAAEKTNE